MHWKQNFLQDQKALLEDSSTISWIRLFVYGFYKMGNTEEQPPSLGRFQQQKPELYTRSCVAAAIFLSQIQVILLKIAKRHVLSPVPDGSWQSLRQANFNIDVELVIVFL